MWHQQLVDHIVNSSTTKTPPGSKNYPISRPLEWQHPLFRIAGMVLYIYGFDPLLSAGILISKVNGSKTLEEKIGNSRSQCRYIRRT